jgi:fructose-1,6-bisphosphatase I
MQALWFDVQQAGGLAIAGVAERILDIKPERLHQRVPFFVGSKNMVCKLERFLREFS